MRKNGELLEAKGDISQPTYTVDKGDAVVLECCNVGSEYLSTVKWKDGDGVFVLANDNIFLENNTLTFADIGNSDARKYQCVVGGGLAESGLVELKVRDPEAVLEIEPLMVSASSSIVCASPGGSAELSCTVSGTYREFGWTFNGKSVGNDFQLLITDIQQNNAGMYTCRATAEEGVNPSSEKAVIKLDLKCKLPKVWFV